MRSLAIAILLLMLSTGVASAEKTQKVVFEAAIGADGVQTVSVLGGSYFFNPNHIIVKANVPVRLLFKKETGLAPHNMVIDAPEAGIDVDVEMKSKEKSVTFTPTRAGTYKITCTKKLLFFASHEEKGMSGVLEVID